MDRLFDVPPTKRKLGPKPIRSLKGGDLLYEITFGLQKQYLRAPDTDMALTWWQQSHPALTRDDCHIREYPQSELDELVTVDPKLAGRLRRL